MLVGKGGRACLYKFFYSQIKSSLYSPYYAEACNEWRGPSPRLSAWKTQLRRNVATMASRWRHCADLTGPGIELQTFRTDSVRLATELTGRYFSTILINFVNIAERRNFSATSQASDVQTTRYGNWNE